MIIHPNFYQRAQANKTFMSFLLTLIYEGLENKYPQYQLDTGEFDHCCIHRMEKEKLREMRMTMSGISQVKFGSILDITQRERKKEGRYHTGAEEQRSCLHSLIINITDLIQTLIVLLILDIGQMRWICIRIAIDHRRCRRIFL